MPTSLPQEGSSSPRLSRLVEDKDHCGCCGQAITQDPSHVFRSTLWCRRCISHLLSPSDEKGHPRHLWERTYEAQYGAPCPYAVNQISLEERLGLEGQL